MEATASRDSTPGRLSGTLPMVGTNSRVSPEANLYQELGRLSGIPDLTQSNIEERSELEMLQLAMTLDAHPELLNNLEPGSVKEPVVVTPLDNNADSIKVVIQKSAIQVYAMDPFTSGTQFDFVISSSGLTVEATERGSTTFYTVTSSEFAQYQITSHQIVRDEIILTLAKIEQESPAVAVDAKEEVESDDPDDSFPGVESVHDGPVRHHSASSVRGYVPHSRE